MTSASTTSASTTSASTARPLPARARVLVAAPVAVVLVVVAGSLVATDELGAAVAWSLLGGATAGLAAAGAAAAALTRLARALRLRARLADEVAEQHRQEAEAVAAGVFALLSDLVAAEEGVRGQLAAELHDTVAQSLAVARSMLVRPGAPADGSPAAEFVADAEEQLRAVMARARPPALRDGDLASAVTLLRADFAARYGLDVRVSWPERPHPLPLATAVTVYRFLQEGLLNVVKHADVDDARVTLEITEADVVATVSDDGPGFDPTQVVPDRGRHVGLALLRERARLSGGSLEVVGGLASGRGGVTLRLRLPRAAVVRPLHERAGERVAEGPAEPPAGSSRGTPNPVPDPVPDAVPVVPAQRSRSPQPR